MWGCSRGNRNQMNLNKILCATIALLMQMASMSAMDPLPAETSSCRSSEMRDRGYVVVTDHFVSDGTQDVSDEIQKVIDANPRRTIFFPDGIYLISKPIMTPADPHKSVALELSNYAVIKAAEGWNHDEAMVRLGGKDPYNSITIPGSNYYLEGGVIDGSGVAKGVSIDSGRETKICGTSIKNVTLGIHIKHGANSGSSDADISGVNITGNMKPDCVGVLVEGYDNTFTDMRIGGVHIGFILRSQANMLRNIHPLYYSPDTEYHSGCGFLDEAGNNWYDFCYSDQFATAFEIKGGRRSMYQNCFAFWYRASGEKHVFFRSEGKFNSNVQNANVGFNSNNRVKENKVLESSEEGGSGIFQNLFVNDIRSLTDNSHEQYIK